MELNNLKSFDNYLVEGLEDFEINEDSIIFESDSDLEVFFEGDLYEASAPKMTAKDRKKAQEIGQLMKALNKKSSYKAAKEKFIKIFKKEAKSVVRELKLSPKVLKKLNKVTINDI